MARDLRAAADAMRRAAASGDSAAFGEARAAAERLSRARDGLEQQRSDRMARDIDSALVAHAAAGQRAEVDRDRACGRSTRPAPTAAQQVQQLQQRKEAQAAEVADLEKQLDRTASDFRRERPQAARKVQEAADGIRDDRLKEKISYSRGLVQGAPAETAAGFEEQIGADIASLESRLRDGGRGGERAGAGQPRRRDGPRARPRARRRVDGAAAARPAAGQAQAAARVAGPAARAGEQPAAAPGRAGRPGRPAGRRAAGRTEQGGGQRGEAAGGRANDRASRRRRRRPARRRHRRFDPRQFQREARERRTEAQALRRDLQALGVDVKDLDAIIRALAALDSARVYADPTRSRACSSSSRETLQRFQFSLRRELGAADADQLLLSGSDAAPEAYKKQIEEYYRALARDRRSSWQQRAGPCLPKRSRGPPRAPAEQREMPSPAMMAALRQAGEPWPPSRRPRTSLRSAASRLPRCWRPLALTDIAWKVVAFVLLTPLVTLLFRALLAMSGQDVLADQDVLLFFVQPGGLLTASARRRCSWRLWRWSRRR